MRSGSGSVFGLEEAAEDIQAHAAALLWVELGGADVAALHSCNELAAIICSSARDSSLRGERLAGLQNSRAVPQMPCAPSAARHLMSPAPNQRSPG